MEKEHINLLFTNWIDEIKSSVFNKNYICVALFSTDGNLVFANKAMASFFEGEPCKCLINPTFDKLVKIESDSSMVYEGFLTLGDITTDNVKSIKSQIFIKNNELLIVGVADAKKLIKQYESMYDLNRETINLQRQLIKEKHTLQETLDQLNEANLELKEVNATKDKFFSIIAHDLRNPFVVLLGFSDLLAENLKEFSINQIEEQIKLISQTSHQTYELLEDILLWSKTQLGKLTFNPQRIYFEDLYQAVIHNLSNQIQKKNITINFIEHEKSLIFADLNMFKTILRNLISNAIKFTYPNGCITVYCEKKNENLVVSVSDNGIGISPENQARLWKLSEQYTTNGTDGEEGTGLGLFICKEFVEKHGGKIWTESEIGKGSNFKFTIPLYKKEYSEITPVSQIISSSLSQTIST